MKAYKFSTEKEAIEAQEAIFQEYKSSRPQLPEEHWKITKKYAEIKKREDAEEWYFVANPESKLGFEEFEIEDSWAPVIVDFEV